MEIGPIRNQNLIFLPLANDGGQQKIKIVRTNQQSNLGVPANQFSPSAGTSLVTRLYLPLLARVVPV